MVHIDFSSEWISFVNKLNHFHDQKEALNLSVLLDHLSTMVACEAAYLIKVLEGKLDWSSYSVWGDKNLIFEMNMTALHQEILDQGKKICRDSHKLLPIYNRNELVMIFGFYTKKTFDMSVCNHIGAMAEIGYQRLLKNQIIHQLKTSERIFRLTFQQAGSGMCQTSLDGKIRFANKKFYDMIGYTEQEAMGLRIKEITHPEDWEKDRVFKKQLIQKEIPFFSMEKRYIKKDGTLTWVYITVSLMEGDTLEEDILIGVIQDINSQKEADTYRKSQEKALENLVKERTQALVSVNKALIEAHKTKDLVIEELKETKKALEIMAVEDPLTHLYNRRYMMDQLSKEAERFERYQTPFTIIICDIDFFKSINDAYGHNCGDQILVSLSQDLKNGLRKIDILSRWGGEEYLILLPEVDLEAGVFVANRLRAMIEKKVFHYLDEIIQLTMTFGVATYRQEDTIESLIINADDALYRGKNKHRNCVVY